jgi:hypothetical protein
MNKKEEAIKQVKILIKRPTLNGYTRKQFLENILWVLENEC